MSSLYLSGDLKFSLVLQYTADPLDPCKPLAVQNEGVLIKALIDNTTVVLLHFYYVNEVPFNNDGRIPTVMSINSSFLNLTCNDTAYNTTTYATYTTYTVPFTASSAVGPYLYNIIISNDLLYC